MNVSFLHLEREWQEIGAEIEKETIDILRSGNYILGQKVKDFEKSFAEFCGAQYCIGVASGTDALLLALMAKGIRPGDEIITTPFTFFATAGVIARLGAVPVFVDIGDDYNIHPDMVEKKISEKTKAVIPVHLFGHPADMDGFLKLSEKYGLFIVEDACQAVGAEYNGKKAGTIGDFGCFSFYPTKNLGGCGDGGCITVNDDRLHELLLKLRVHGSKPKYFHSLVGINSRLDALQAGILSIKLKYIEKWNNLRNEKAELYCKLFDNAGIKTNAGHNGVHHQIVIEVSNRDTVMGHLKNAGVDCGIYYPLPLHLQKCFEYCGYQEGDLPVCEKASKQILSVPVSPFITEEEIRYVADAVIHAADVR